MSAVDAVKVNIGRKIGRVPRRRNAKAVQYDRARSETPRVCEEVEETPEIEKEIKIKKRSQKREGSDTEVTDV